MSVAPAPCAYAGRGVRGVHAIHLRMHLNVVHGRSSTDAAQPSPSCGLGLLTICCRWWLSPCTVRRAPCTVRQVVKPGSNAAKAEGIEDGMRIIGINGVDVSSYVDKSNVSEIIKKTPGVPIQVTFLNGGL